MKNSLPDSLLSKLAELIAARTALHFPRERWSDLERKASSAAKEFGFTGDEAFIQWLVSSPLTREQIEILASHLTISETYFWREPQVFKALEEQILPGLIRSRENGERRLRIWTAGCSTGEEPYSLAIAIRRAIPSTENWHITILATDINPRILRRAAAGVYGEWSFRNAPPWLKEGYFRRNKDGKFEISPEIRRTVTFAYLNLAEDIYPSAVNHTNAMDLILCRNVLMYFAPERAREVGQGLYRCLVDGGWLIVGASELSQFLFPQFASVNFPGAIVYRRETTMPGPLPVFRPEAIPPQKAMVYSPGIERVAAPSQLRGSGTMPAAASASPRRTANAEALHLGARRRSAEAIEKPEDEGAPRGMPFSIRALANQGRLADALAACEKAIAADKLDPGLHYLRASILQEQNQGSEAIASLKRALYLDPNFVLAHFTLGNLALRQGNARAAKRSFENVLALLSPRPREETLPESGGLTVGRFREIIHATMKVGALA